MSAPVRVALSPDGRLIATDPRTGGVYVLSGDGYSQAFGFRSASSAPLSVAADSEGIYVGEGGSGTIDHFGYDGSYMGRLVKYGIVNKPNDMALDENLGLLFVVDTPERKVKVFNLTGTYIRSFPPGDVAAAGP